MKTLKVIALTAITLTSVYTWADCKDEYKEKILGTNRDITKMENTTSVIGTVWSGAVGSVAVTEVSGGAAVSTTSGGAATLVSTTGIGALAISELAKYQQDLSGAYNLILQAELSDGLELRQLAKDTGILDIDTLANIIIDYNEKSILCGEVGLLTYKEIVQLLKK